MVSYYSSGSITATQVAFASSGRHVVIPFGNILRVYDISSNPPKYTGCMNGHSERVTAVVQIGIMRIASSSKDGTIRIWDVLDGNCLSTIDIGQSISSMIKVGSDKLICFNLNGITSVSLDSKNRNVIDKSMKVFKVGNKYRGNISSSISGNLIAVIDKKKVHLTSVQRKYQPAVSINYPTRITAVSVSEDGTLLAVGTAAGIISVYNDPISFFKDKGTNNCIDVADARPAILHWHALPVRALQFSPDNAVLLSGGQERVLVSWKMTSTGFGTRSFLPRLGASILSISISLDETMYAIMHANNSVSLVSPASNSVASNIRGIAVPSGSTNASLYANETNGPIAFCKRACVAVDKSRSGALLIAGQDNEIQTFNMYSGIQISDFSLSSRNITSEPRSRREKDEKPGNGEITQLCANEDGSQIATVEVQPLSVFSSNHYGTESVAVTLKIWQRNSPEDYPKLEAMITNPHDSDMNVSSLSFHPSLPLLISTSHSGTMRIWRKVSGRKNKDMILWRNELEQKYKDLPCLDACFSDDGSVLIAAYGHLVTLWSITDLTSVEQKNNGDGNDQYVNEFSPCSVHIECETTLAHPPPEEHIEKVAYLNARIPLVVSATKCGVYVWNLLTQGIWWSSRILHIPRCMTIDNVSGRFAIATQIPGIVTDNVESEDLHSLGRQEKSDEMNDQQKKSLSNDEEHTTENMIPADEKSNFGRVKNPKDQNKAKMVPKRRRNQTRIDHAISIFNAMSPIPENVIRMNTDVKIASLQFLLNPSSSKDQSVLVSLSSNLDISFHTVGDKNQNQNSQDDVPLPLRSSYEAVVKQSQNSFIPGLKQGPDEETEKLWQVPQSIQNEQKLTENGKLHINNHKNTSVNSILLENFSGSIHLRPSCATSARDLIGSLVDYITSTDKQSEEESIIPLYQDKTDTVQKDNTPKELDVASFGVELGKRELESHRSLQKFCAKLVQ